MLMRIVRTGKTEMSMSSDDGFQPTASVTTPSVSSARSQFYKPCGGGGIYLLMAYGSFVINVTMLVMAMLVLQ